ncbi:hypothetical protein Chls_460 [Chlamydia suis]|uniref:Uncharacterized protein n=1 Tax=Chlamydia suis TaxID=83559 RepID=A0ABX6IQQ7_9CHLA|nr:hypothetical protein Chls_460 [Chlamydia suis]
MHLTTLLQEGNQDTHIPELPHTLTTQPLLVAIENTPHAQPHQEDLQTFAFLVR